MDSLHPFTIISTAECYSQSQNSYVFIRAVIKKWGPGISHGYFHRKIEEKISSEIPSYLIPRLLVVPSRQLKILVTALYSYMFCEEDL